MRAGGRPGTGQSRRERLGAEADVLTGGHLIALSQPDALARYLLREAPGPARHAP